MKKAFLVILILLNAVVLLGQVWPEGAPPFASKVTLVFLILSLFFFVFSLFATKSKRR